MHYLPDDGWQLVIPSPTYPLLHTQLNVPAVLTQVAALGRQLWDPWAHSSMSEIE